MERAHRTHVLAIALVCFSAIPTFVVAQSPPGPATPDRRAIPSGHNWFCFDDPQPAGGMLSNCSRTQAACERVREPRRRSGENTARCAAFNAAATCFSYRDFLELHGERRLFCSRNAAGCNDMRARLVASATEQPVYREISGCGALP